MARREGIRFNAGMKKPCLAALFALIAAPSLAQNDTALERASGQAVGLFVQACVPFTGDAAGVRRWADEHRLGLIAPDKARVIMVGSVTGQVFGASNADGNFVLVSLDNGFCEVVAEIGDMKVAGEFLSEFLKVDGYSIVPVKGMERAGVSQQRFDLSRAQKKLQVSVTQFDGEPATPPQLRLTATPAP